MQTRENSKTDTQSFRMTKSDYMRLISNSQNEVSARLDAIIRARKTHNVRDLCDQLDLVIDRVRQIKLSLIFLKNIEEKE